MEKAAIIHCSECRRPILLGEGFVRFKVPGQGAYQCFHRRCDTGDCWEKRLMQGIKDLILFMGSNAGVPASEKLPVLSRSM